MASLSGGNFMKRWFAVEALPIVGIVAFVTSGGTYLLYRAARGPDVIWTSKNPQPWQTISPDQQVKMLTVHQQYKGGNWKREKW